MKHLIVLLLCFFTLGLSAQTDKKAEDADINETIEKMEEMLNSIDLDEKMEEAIKEMSKQLDKVDFEKLGEMLGSSLKILESIDPEEILSKVEELGLEDKMEGMLEEIEKNIPEEIKEKNTKKKKL